MSAAAEFGLLWYRARWYDPGLGRWAVFDRAQPDTVAPVANQGVQAWDRYAYVNNNPVRWNDPSGHFSEDQIKEIFGFSEDDNWEKVLVIFEKGGKFAGRWGWLSVLKKAEIGDQITIDWTERILPEDHPAINDKLQFELGPQGDLILVGDSFYLDSKVAGLYGEKYELTHFETNTGKRVAAAFLVVATDLTVGIPAFIAMVSGNPALMKAGEFLETAVVLPVNILAVKMWADADREKFEVLTVQAIPITNRPQ